MQRELETVRLELDEETNVAEITLNRPDSLNAMNQAMKREITECLDILSDIDAGHVGVAANVIVIEGAGDRAFSAGADINEFSERNPSDYAPSDFRDEIMNFPAPIVAKIDGYCLGGGLETAFACDFRFASERSELGLPEVDLGLIPGGGGAQFVSRLANPSVAKEIAMTGKHVPATEAAEMGLINDWYPTDQFDAEIASFIETLADRAPLALRAIKDSVDKSVEIGLEASRQYDRRVFSTLLKTDDHREGISAFSEKREPRFNGR